MKVVEVAIIGSGPGGAISAAMLAKAGKEVMLIEKGEFLSLSSCTPFSQQEMLQKYNKSGVTVALGKPKVAYVEGSCVGGGSEVNSGLYFRTPEPIIDSWAKNYQIDLFTLDSLLPYFTQNEHELSVSYMPPNKIPKASFMLQQGANALGWDSYEVPRWFKYNADGSGIKQSMTETVIPTAIKNGATLISNTLITKITKVNELWFLEGNKTINAVVEKFELSAKFLFLCGGAISTAHVLRKNHLSKLAGRSLHMHPTIKMVARFPENINDEHMGVPVHQVKEFSPRFSFGCSISSRLYLSLAMLDVPYGQMLVDNHWRQMAIYYSMVINGNGTVSNSLIGQDPLVKYKLGNDGIKETLNGLLYLGKCLFAAGALEVFPVIYNSVAIKNLAQLERFIYEISTNQLNLMTIHLFSSCPMGQDKNICVTDSYGKVFGVDNLYINDASLLCTALGVNPQGTIMAIARRNIDHFLNG